MNNVKIFLLWLLAGTTILSNAEIPSGYYDSVKNKKDRALLEALNSKVGPHTNVGYDGLFSVYTTSDVHPNGKIWDMYSTKEWAESNKCGNYKNVGDCYNREHAVPQSWFNSASPMKSDAFHVYPTDGKVNGQRSNHPYGECANGTYLPSHNGVRPLGRLGSSTFTGYSGTVFEPDDEYKGDFARSYFYMAAAYYDRIASWDSPMLAGNNYPAFTTWGVNLLLKWHRQDPVSDKEINRNDAVYAHQHNRNPFIDYPELAEHIWGNKKGTAWAPNAAVDPEIVQPLENTAVDFGVSSIGHSLSKTVTVRTIGVQSAVTVSVSGSGFSASTTSLAASATNSAQGTSLAVQFKPTAEGAATGTLTLRCGSLSRTVALRGTGVDGLPAGPAQYVTDESFVATWVYIGDDDNGKYTLDVYSPSAAVQGYPRQVTAATGSYEVEGLEPNTQYIYTIASKQMESEPVYVTTGEPMPSVEFLFDGDLFFTAFPGEPSEVAELLMDIDNISTDVTVSIGEPFEVSADRTNWAQSTMVNPDVARVYLRMFADDPGTYSSTLLARAGEYTSKGVTIEGTASDSSTFFEDFEADNKGFATYVNGEVYAGTACRWLLSNAGVYDESSVSSGSQSVRFGKNNNSYIEMAEDIAMGIGTVSFYAKYWGSEADPVIEVQVSTDGGQSFTKAGEVTVNSNNYNKYSVYVGVGGSSRIRLQQTSGQRLNLDDLALTRFSSSGLADPEAARHAWDAYPGVDGVTVTVTRTTTLGVYALDGTVVLYGELAPGTYEIPASEGLYIVASDDFSRRVVVR